MFNSEKKIVLLISAIQFVNILEFMVVMPLGPDFARDLGIPMSDIGYVGGVYTLAASLAGFIGSLVLDRFNRKAAIITAISGLVVATTLAGLAQSYTLMIIARLAAGLSGGPATALAMALVADLVPTERRGRAMGAVMASFAVASVVGIPLSLQIAAELSWRWSFFAVALLGVCIIAIGVVWLPSFKPDYQPQSLAREIKASGRLLTDPDVAIAMLTIICMSIAVFMLVPNIAPFILFNLGYPRADLGQLYLVGGIFAFVSMTQVGKLVDRIGSAHISVVATVVYTATIYFGFAKETDGISAMLMFILFMSFSSMRSVSYSTLSSKVPPARLRGRFMSIQSAVQHIASAAGAFLSAKMLTVRPDHGLAGMTNVALLSMGLALTMPPLMYLAECRLRRREPG